MKTKLMCIMLMLAVALNLSACGDSEENRNSFENGITIGAFQSEEDSSSENKGNEGDSNNTVNQQKIGADENAANASDNVQSPVEVGSVNSSAFSGKVRGCYYADGNRIIVAADKLYLYDTQKGESVSSVDISIEDLCVQTYAAGYFVVGQGSGGSGNSSFVTSQDSSGIIGYLLNNDFKIENTISFSGLLSDDFVLGMAGVAISQDGKQIAFGGLRGLYLYNTSAGELSTILNYSEDGVANNMQIMTIDSLAFTEDNTLVYTGTGTDSSNGGEGFSIYGTVSVDSGRLVITRKADYEIEEMQKGGDLLVMPQVFNKNNGTLLMLDTASNTEKTIVFSSGSEGKDGVFCSQQGRYVATSVLDGNNVTINIYDTASGKAIHTETVKDSNSIYFLRVPQILILDESNTCIVVLGRGIDEVSTLMTTFGFEG